LKPGGKLIPSSVDLFVTLMECPELFQFTFVPHLSLRSACATFYATANGGFPRSSKRFSASTPKLFKIVAEAEPFVPRL